MKGLWSGICEHIKADQARNEANWLDGMDWSGGDGLWREADIHDREADYLDGDL